MRPKHNTIQGLRVRVPVEMSDRGGGSLNTQYSIIDPWTLNPETATYNTIQGLRVRVPVEMSERGGGSLNTQY